MYTPRDSQKEDSKSLRKLTFAAGKHTSLLPTKAIRRNGHGGEGLMVELDDLYGFFQPQ